MRSRRRTFALAAGAALTIVTTMLLVPTLQAQAKVHPCIAGLDAVFTNVLVCGGELDLFQVRAVFSHVFLSLKLPP